MCGIAGFISLDGPRERPWLAALGRTLTEALHHRGESAAEPWVSPDGTVMLACVRLAVRDRSAAGDQPMASPDGRVTLVSNGEVYGSRTPLPEPWPRRTHCDTEFVLQQVSGAGDPAPVLAGLDGMFALAWHDERTGRTALARDHFGVKPLVYCRTAGGLLFASEPQALLATGLIAPEVDRTEFVLRSWVRMDAADERTWLTGVHALQPAEYLVVEGARVRTGRYWQVPFADEPVGAEEIRAAFDRAVALRAAADVPRAAVLSGGVDSSAIFAALHTQGVALRPYVVRYEEGIGGSDSDVAHARTVAATHQVPLTVVELSRRDAVKLIPEVAGRLARPMLHGAELAMYQLYERIAAEGQVVVYSGHGADEMWGYQDGGYFPVVAPDAPTHLHGRHYLTHRLYPDERPLWGELVEWLAGQLDVDMGGIRERVWERVLREYRAPDTLDPLKRGRHHLMRRFLVYVNDMVDLTSSTYTLEDRPVFQDVALAELAFRSPEHLKSTGKPGSHKDLLKKALGGLLPPSVVHRRKQGFPAPSDPSYREALRALADEQGMPFGLPEPPGPLKAALGTGELMYLASASAWLAGTGK
ncbi:asparagine synthetase B [Streptomyces sp. BPTC-684]|uniref:asparagine synthetase B family protein n=1 Tax=Streptomyces sp. BPTC-684 TaxID=3043734 RepID=UPI0024B0C6ED|nr:asparagine synthetase B [Streptomyces sp. BPTC-684]WHM37604.1 asparagine synthetase B [Streptomyces sp. BPTC-684]